MHDCWVCTSNAAAAAADDDLHPYLACFQSASEPESGGGGDRSELWMIAVYWIALLILVLVYS